MPELFSIAKATKSMVDPMAWWKSVMIGLKIALVVAFLYSGYIAFVKPHFNPLPTTTQRAETIQNIEHHYPDDTFFIGIKLFGVKIGVSK